IPLRPSLSDAAVGVERVETVLPDASGGGGEHVDPDRAGETGEARRNRIGQLVLAALREEDPIRQFGEHARTAAEGETGFRVRLVPAAHDVVGTGTDRSGNDTGRVLSAQQGNAP